jgi:signal transduction histidine kinase
VQLKTRFRITTAVSLGAAVLLVLLMVFAFQEASHANRGNALASALLRETFERALLRDEFLILGEPRARQQMEAKTLGLQRLIDQARVEFQDEEERRIVGELAGLLERSAGLFAALTGDAEQPGRSPELAEAFRDRAISQLLLNSHDLHARGRQLATAAAARFDATQRHVVVVLFATLAGVFAITFFNLRVTAVTMERRITLLREGAERVAGGRLDHRIGVQGDDELADLGRAFDAMTAQLQVKVAALEVSNRELESFSYAVSHDLRAPLRSISGFSQAALEDYGPKLDEQGRQFLQMASDAAREMSRLIDDLLTLARVARVEMVREPVDLSALAEATAAELRQAEPARRVEFVIEPDLVASGDPRLLGLVIDNLLRNAWKFTSRHASAKIIFGRTRAGGRDTFFVSDDGAGFDMAYVDKLFQPFQRLHRTVEYPGTGIGLATVNRIVRRHGGEARASGGVERGATISFTLQPAEEAHA